MARRRSSAETEQAARARREHQLDELHAQLTTGVEQLTSSEQWIAWLRVASRFHSYSWNNTLLIHLQRPEATRVAGYRTWRQSGRQVDKGEHGIQILAPVIRRRGAEEASSEAAAPDGAATGDEKANGDDPGRRRVVGFRVAHVFDIGQTSGDPLPEPERPELVLGQAPEGLWDELAAQIAARGFTVQRGPCDGQANGYTDFLDRRVMVRADVDDAQAVKTLAHELGHVLMHGPEQLAARDTRLCRGAAEVEAESVAYLVASAYGFDVSGYTFPYVATWAAGVGDGRSGQIADVVQRSAVPVLATAHQVLEAADQSKVQPAAGDSRDLRERTQLGEPRASRLRERADELASPGHNQTLAPTGASQPRSVDRTLVANAAAADWWRERLQRPEQAGPRQYLVDRGVGHVLAADSPWHVGYADSEWTNLVDHLRTQGFTDAELLGAGLAMRSRKGNLVNRFRERIMLPIRRPDGGIVGFIGRAAPGASPDVPKYLNTASTAAFTKGDVLFGLAEQSETISHGRTLIVEGPFDVLAVAGVRSDIAAVAPCGTALTSRQVAALAEQAPHVAVALDADPAGDDATVRAYEVLRGAYRDPELVQLPAGADPADLAAGGDGRLAAVLGQPSRLLADAVVDRAIAAHDLSDAQQLAVANRHAAAVIADLPAEQIAREVARVAEQLDLDASIVTESVADALTRQTEPARRADRVQRRADTPATPAATRATARLPRPSTGLGWTRRSGDHRRGTPSAGVTTAPAARPPR